MKILWVGDAAVSSGFSECTHRVCDHLHALGHEIHILGLNYWGDPHPYPYPIYPCYQPLAGGRDSFGVTRLPHLVDHIRPDVVVILNDPWNVPEYVEALHDHARAVHTDGGPLPSFPSLLAWLAVDGENQHGAALNRHRILTHLVTWTRFSDTQLRAGGYVGPSTVVPLGVDLDLFRPRDRSTSRAACFPPELADAFLVGVVGRNQPRKRLDLTLKYFAEWVHTHNIPNAYLYLHVAPTGDAGTDLRSLVRYHDLGGRVLLAQIPPVHGLPRSRMPEVYSALDVYLTTTQGEGWGLPCLEAMACGVPAIVPAWSGLGEWTAGAAIQIPCTSTALTAPINGQMYTVGGVADMEAAVAALDLLYRHPDLRLEWGARGRARAADYPWERSAAGMAKVIESVVRDATNRKVSQSQPMAATAPAAAEVHRA